MNSIKEFDILDYVCTSLSIVTCIILFTVILTALIKMNFRIEKWAAVTLMAYFIGAAIRATRWLVYAL